MQWRGDGDRDRDKERDRAAGFDIAMGYLFSRFSGCKELGTADEKVQAIEDFCQTIQDTFSSVWDLPSQVFVT